MLYRFQFDAESSNLSHQIFRKNRAIDLITLKTLIELLNFTLSE